MARMTNCERNRAAGRNCVPITVPLIALEGAHGVGKSSLWPHLNRELNLNYSGLDRCFLSVWAFAKLFNRPAVDLEASARAYFANDAAVLVFLAGDGLPDKPHPDAKQSVPYDNSELRDLLMQGFQTLGAMGYQKRLLLVHSKSAPPEAIAADIATWVQLRAPNGYDFDHHDQQYGAMRQEQTNGN